MVRLKKMSKEDYISFLGEVTIEQSDIPNELKKLNSEAKRIGNSLDHFSMNRYHFTALKDHDNNFYFNLGEEMRSYHYTNVNKLHHLFRVFSYEDFENFFNALQRKTNQHYEYFIDFILEDRLFRKSVDWSQRISNCEKFLNRTKAKKFAQFHDLTLYDICDGIVLDVGDIGVSPTLNNYYYIGYYGLALSFVRENIERLENRKTTIIDLTEFL